MRLYSPSFREGVFSETQSIGSNKRAGLLDPGSAATFAAYLTMPLFRAGALVLLPHAVVVTPNTKATTNRTANSLNSRCKLYLPFLAGWRLSPIPYTSRSIKRTTS